MEKFTLPNMIREFTSRQEEIQARLGMKTKEGFNDDPTDKASTFLGLSLAVFLIVLTINLALFIGALWVVNNAYKKKYITKEYAILAAVLSFFFPVIVLIVMLIFFNGN